jgi:hypothetical protein
VGLGRFGGLRSIPQGHLIAFVDFFGFVSFRGVSNPQKPLEFVCVTLTENYKGCAKGEGMDCRWSGVGYDQNPKTTKYAPNPRTSKNPILRMNDKDFRG